MRKTLSLFMLGVLITFTAKSQGIVYNIDLSNSVSVNQNLKALAKSETDFWASALKLDSVLTAKLESNNASLYNQYIHVMKSFNYKMEKILLVEQKNFKDRRNRFMKMFLSEKQYKIYREIEVRAGKKALKKYKNDANVEIRRMRVQAAGWNVLNHRINFR